MKFSIRPHLLIIFLLGILPTSSFGVVVTLASGRVSEITTSSGDQVTDSLFRVGRLTGTPAGSSIAEISLVFEELDSFDSGFLGQPFGTVSESDPSASDFNNQDIYIWAFDTALVSDATEHALFTNPTAVPNDGDAWIFPVHTGTGIDAATLNSSSLIAEGDFSFTPGARVESLGANSIRLVLTPIPEPSAPLFLALTGITAAFYRRR